MSEETKKCTRCGDIKQLSIFSRTKRTKSGFAAICKKCAVEKSTIYSINNKEKVKQRKSEYQKAYKTRKNELRREAYKKNPEKINKTKRLWEEKNKEKHKAIRAKVAQRRIVNLCNGYLAERMGIKVSELTPEIAEMKRQQLQIHRLAQEFKRAVKESFK